MIARAAAGDPAYADDLAALRSKHVDTAADLLGGPGSPEYEAFVSRLDADTGDLLAVLRAIKIAGAATDMLADFVVGHGELWCAALWAAHLRTRGADAEMVDARDALVVTPTPDGTSVDVEYDASDAALDAWATASSGRRRDVPGQAGPVAPILIVTGFIARTPEGTVTTLRRNGSDYSATIVGALLRSAAITIWTDVDGVFSADPRKVPEAVCLPSLTYLEAWELAYFGASVLHPRTTQPAMRAGVPIAIRNFFNLDAPGTVIAGQEAEALAAVESGTSAGVVAAAAAPSSSSSTSRRGHAGSLGDGMVKGFATIDNVSLISVEGTGMVGVPGTASAIFTTVRDAACNVVMISQASSEHSVCFAVKADEAPRAVAALEARFADAIRRGRIQAVEVIPDCCVLAAVGQSMNSRKGVAATMFSALAKASINIRAMAQGCSEYNITVLVDQADAVRALRAVHSRFYLATLPLGIAVVGPGLVGGTLLAQLADQAAELRDCYDVDCRLLAVAGSSSMVLSDGGLPLAEWGAAYRSDAAQPVDLKKLGDHLAASYVPNCVVIDATASDGPPAMYLPWLKQGIHVITPNKKLGAGPLAQYKAVRSYSRANYTHWLYEATVGAGLPVIATLKHLVDSGDRVLKVEGVFSGTLSYIFNTLSADPTATFSSVVADAKAAGYTEPDPRDDLSGTDVARKVVILAREAGVDVELADVPVESLVPKELQSAPDADAFLAGLPAHDAAFSARLAKAASEGKALRYVGVVDVEHGKGSVGLVEYPAGHAFASLEGSDNIIAFTTARYRAQPLIVRGPGAGAEVTAGGIFSDLLRLAAYLGAPS
jgi:bifunctional aspartokinase / homoserine dehydrogenase 1